MKEPELLEYITDFVEGLLKKANVKHAGNCLVMSQILQPYLQLFLDIRTEIINTWVKQDDDLVNHYCLQMKNGKIIDATASQFSGMPKVYIGVRPKYYLPIQEAPDGKLYAERKIPGICDNCGKKKADHFFFTFCEGKRFAKQGHGIK